MSTQRLTFLYPHLFRTVRLGESVTTSSSPHYRRRPATCSPGRPAKHGTAAFGTSTASKKATFAPRVGKGIEPKPLGNVQAAPALESQMKEDDVIPLPPPDTRDSTPEQRKDAAKALDPAAEPVKESLSSPGVSLSGQKNDGEEETQESSPKKKRATGPMDAVLHMEPPKNQQPDEKPPHLTPPPYVHHFDSYSLVKQLEDGGYTQEQAITAMKAVRTLLAHNLDVAQGGLISKSDVENETYLFRAACAELSTEVKNNRRIAEEHLRQERTILQHEVDNTTQTLNQELLTLNDNVRGMFNDRKMAVREEQKKAEGTIQQITYKMSVVLNSDSKSEIETVRWVLARRAVLGIVFMVTLSLAMLRYGSYLSHESKKEAQREKEESEVLRRSAGTIDAAPSPDAAAILAAN